MPVFLELVVSPHFLMWTVVGQGWSVHRKDSGHDAAEALGGSNHVDFPMVSWTLWLCRCTSPHFRASSCMLLSRSYWKALMLSARLSCWPCKFSRCFKPKMGTLVLCPRRVPSLSVRFTEPQEQMPSAWMLTCQWMWILFHFSFSLPFGQCYSEHLAFCFWLIVKQTDITESALDTTVLRQC